MVPDSAQIAFSSNKDGELFEVFTVDAEGGSLRKVATTAEGMFEPSWSPDGSMIAFAEGGAIYSVDLGGGEPQRITDTENNDSSPAWNPRPPPAEE